MGGRRKPSTEAGASAGTAERANGRSSAASSRASSRAEAVRQGELEEQRKELGGKIFAQILAYDADNNGYIDADEMKIFLKATNQWDTDELYSDAEWENGWPDVCEILGVADAALGMPVEAFVRYAERYRSEMLESDLSALEATVGAEFVSPVPRREAPEPEPEPEQVRAREPEPEPEPELEPEPDPEPEFSFDADEPEPETWEPVEWVGGADAVDGFMLEAELAPSPRALRSMPEDTHMMLSQDRRLEPAWGQSARAELRLPEESVLQEQEEALREAEDLAEGLAADVARSLQILHPQPPGAPRSLLTGAAYFTSNGALFASFSPKTGAFWGDFG